MSKEQQSLWENPILRGVLAIVLGFIIGSAVNIAIVILSVNVMPLPEGVDMKNLAEHTDKLTTGHWIFAFTAHALGTLVGAFVAAKLALNNRMKYAYAVGILFLFGGIANVISLKPTLIFKVIDLALAYIPMGWLGGRMATKS